VVSFRCEAKMVRRPDGRPSWPSFRVGLMTPTPFRPQFR
jgi:hypothetical protein